MGDASIPLLLTMGITGSLHCAGMCGPLAVLATSGERANRLLTILLYLAGKTSSYVLLGALAGALGETIVRAAPLGIGSRLLAVLGGALLAVVGLHSIGLVRDSLVGVGWLMRVAGILRTLAGEGGLTGRLLLGSANGLLPCPMTYAFLAIAAASGSPLGGIVTMLILGITTAVPLAVCAFAGYRLSRLRLLRLPVLTGALMLAVASLMLWRGLGASGAAPHCH